MGRPNGWKNAVWSVKLATSTLDHGFTYEHRKYSTDMPNSPSAKKSMRKANARRDRNRAARSALRTVLKKFHTTVAGSDAAAAESAFRLVVKKLDQAAAKHLIHKNAAARTKSRLSRHLKKTSAAS
jgi:small subunit ribosomal protein S20